MREVQLALVLAAAHVVVRRGRKVHLHKTSPLGGGNAAQALLPLHLGGFAFALELVDVVRLVVEHHQLGQARQKLQHIAPRIAAVQHIQAVACGAAWRQRQHGTHHQVRVQRRAQGLHVFHFVIQHLTLGQQMPVGDGNHAVAGGFQANLGLAAHIAAHKGKHRIAVGLRHKQVSKLINVGGAEIAP